MPSHRRGLSALLMLSACSAAPTLTRMDKEPAGDNCPMGGIALRTGVDKDGNGTLDLAEATATQHLCNGTEGPQGASTAGQLTELQRVTEGCVGAGVVLRAGIDTNGNGTLEPTEVTRTQTLCFNEGTKIEGSVVVHNDRELAALAGVEEITGDLTIEAPGLTSLSTLGSVRQVRGDLALRNISFTTLALTALVDVGGDISVDFAGPLESVDLPVLTKLGGSLRIDNAPALANISLPVLTKVPGSLSVNNANALSSIAAPLLAEATGGVVLNQVASLATLELPALTTVDTFSISQAAALISIQLPLLAKAGGDITLRALPQLTEAALPLIASVGRLEVASTGLKTLSLPVLVEATAGGLSIEDQSTMTALAFPQLARMAGGFQVSRCPALNSMVTPLLATIGQSLYLELVGSAQTFDLKVEMPALTSATQIFLVETQARAALWPQLKTTGYLQLENNGHMETLVAPQLSVSGPAISRFNDQLKNWCLSPKLATDLSVSRYAGTLSDPIVGQALGCAYED